MCSNTYERRLFGVAKWENQRRFKIDRIDTTFTASIDDRLA